ncbi:MAG: glutamate--tRNA ligase family protein [Bacteroidota bacterium]
MNTALAIRSRLAPTPSGFLHIGNIFNFVLARLETDRLGGTLLLRIDDADSSRVRESYTEDVFTTLNQLGLRYDEGAKNITDFKSNYSQFLRKKHYDTLLDKLARSGFLFACNCSRSDLLKNPEHTVCKQQSVAEFTNGYAWRLNTESAGIVTVNDYQSGLHPVGVHVATPYPVMRKKDGFAAYTVCSLSDDVNYGINLIVRGLDLMSQTALQLYVAKLCGISSFADTRFFHHRLLSDAAGNKLSKSAGAQGVSLMSSLSPAQIFSFISAELGLENSLTYAELKTNYMNVHGSV